MKFKKQQIIKLRKLSQLLLLHPFVRTAAYTMDYSALGGGGRGAMGLRRHAKMR